MKKLGSSGFIIIAMFLGILTGAILGEKASIFAPLGDIFLKLITMLIVPLVFFSIISGAASLGKTKSAGKIGILTLAYYLFTSAIAVVIGITSGIIFKPGIGITVPKSLLTDSSTYAAAGKVTGFWDTILGIIPSNPFNSLTTGNILQILVFALFFGICLSTLNEKKQKPLLDILDTINEVLIKMVSKILFFAPFGVFGLMANSIALFGIDILALVVKLFSVFTLALGLIHFIMIPGLVKVFTGLNPIKFIKTLAPAQILAFSTASSMATLPVNKQCCEKLGVDNATSSFILPLGATINMNGNAMLYGLVSIFFAQMFNIELGTTQYIAIILTSVLGAVGTAGVPGPSLLVVAVLAAAGIPVIALPLVFGIDRIMDMMRTSTNIFGDASCAVIMDHIIKKEKHS
ncbi:dicarboxylate/amino acid:cation symporter [uncultured Cetobacterium sp.]|uniref:dicarboxylate/amino acid:cation symporter n=1 Tax=uncultured Cetobacterium sp. TaxID=527638 RepID=UPI002616F353|nr:dicarboxylate/amino acid:cation symporter [uncultured Cetobacterium sp.]